MRFGIYHSIYSHKLQMMVIYSTIYCNSNFNHDSIASSLFKFAPNAEVIFSARSLRPPTGSPKPDEVPRHPITMIFESLMFLDNFHSFV